MIARTEYVYEYIRRVNSAARPAPTATARRISRDNASTATRNVQIDTVLPRAPFPVPCWIGPAECSQYGLNHTEEALRDVTVSGACKLRVVWYVWPSAGMLLDSTYHWKWWGKGESRVAWSMRGGGRRGGARRRRCWHSTAVDDAVVCEEQSGDIVQELWIVPYAGLYHRRRHAMSSIIDTHSARPPTLYIANLFMIYIAIITLRKAM